MLGISLRCKLRSSQVFPESETFLLAFTGKFLVFPLCAAAFECPSVLVSCSQKGKKRKIKES